MRVVDSENQCNVAANLQSDLKGTPHSFSENCQMAPVWLLKSFQPKNDIEYVYSII